MVSPVDGEVGDEEDFSVDVVEGLVDPFFTMEKSDRRKFAGDFFDFGFVVGEVGGGDSEVDDDAGSDGVGRSCVRTPLPPFIRGE